MFSVLFRPAQPYCTTYVAIPVPISDPDQSSFGYGQTDFVRKIYNLNMKASYNTLCFDFALFKLNREVSRR